MEEQSYILDFTRTPLFFDRWNIDFTVNEMKQNANNFQIVYTGHAPDNINDCLTGGVLNTTNVVVNNNYIVDFSLKYDDGVISVRNDATLTLNDYIYPLKAVFIRNKATGFVMGYCINTTAFEITNSIKLAKDTILWSITDG